jgi:hypothetical protein
MAIAGPSIQMPSSRSPVVNQEQNIQRDWAAFMHSVQQTVFNITRSGPTTSRPTSKLEGRFVGMPYFDTTLGYEVRLKSVNPDVWVRWDGTPV